MPFLSVCFPIFILVLWILGQKYFGWFPWETLWKQDTVLNRTGYVLITGCSSGIGKDCIRELIRLGFSVFAGVRSEEHVQMLRQEFPSDRLFPLIIDVTIPETIKTAKLFIKQTVGESGLVALINNAGIAIPGPLEVISDELIKQQFDVNVFGVIRMCRTFIPLLRKYVAPNNTCGRIINISSIAGFLVFPGLGAYAASKHALEAITESFRLELKPWKIHVCSIQPSNIRTPIWDKGETFYWQIRNSCSLTKQERYRQLFSVLLRTGQIARETAAPTRAVVDSVIHAVRSSVPKYRYTVGREAKLLYYLRLLRSHKKWEDVLHETLSL